MGGTPSLEGIGKLACVCKQTVVNCLKVLQLYGFVAVHRRITRIRTPLGFKVVQDTNAMRHETPPPGEGPPETALLRVAAFSPIGQGNHLCRLRVHLGKPG